MITTAFTPLNIEHCTLNEARIDLWQFSLERPLANAQELLSPQEQARGERFHFPRHKRRFCTARAMMKLILSRYLNTNPARLEFTYNAHGKPEIIDAQKLQFNLSHSGDLALLAVGKTHSLGIDIEQYSERPYEGIAKNLFSAVEYAELMKIPAPLKPAVFFHIWAQKEAFIKASGLGLSYPTQEFTVPTCIPSKQLIFDPLHQVTWMLRSFMPRLALSAALCHHPEVREICHGVVEMEHGTGLNFDV